MAEKRLLITGSEGFIGKKLSKYLDAKGMNVIKVDKSIGYDLTSRNCLERIGACDKVIHLAALSFVPDSYNNPELFYRTNLLSALTVLEYCRKSNCKMVLISSYVYGKPDYLPIDEKHRISAYNPYAQSKIICEEICEGYNRDFQVPVIILRPFNIFGIGQNPKFLIPEIFSQLLEGKTEITLKDPSPRRDYVHVDDVVRAIDSVISSDRSSGTYNVCSNTSYSVREITEIINRNIRRPVKFIFTAEGKRVADIDDTCGSFEKINKETGWSPLLTFEEGIKKDIRELGL